MNATRILQNLEETFEDVLKIALRRETRAPVLALIFASAMSVGLVLTRIAWTGRLSYTFLAWNLFLAWFPLGFAMLVCELERRNELRTWRCAAAALGWFFFFPNAPYTFTDIVHLKSHYYSSHFWLDLVLVLSCAVTGLVLGFLSLYLMQGVVTRKFNRATGWLFVAAMAGLCGFGIFLGRFVRLHSWDVVVRPHRVVSTLQDWISNPLASFNTSIFPALFAAFLFISYVLLYALTHLRPVETSEASLSTPKAEC